MKIGVLGGGNPHALSLARYLRFLGIECFGLGRSPPKAPPLWLVPEGYRYYRARLGDEQSKVLEILDHEKPEVIVNYAAQGESAASFGEHAFRYYATNCVALVGLVTALRSRKYLKRFVQISTSELYGSTPRAATENSRELPTSPYALSKLTFDAHLDIEFKQYGFPMIIIRPSNCYVEGQQLHRIVPRACIAALYQGKVMLQGGGYARKSYLHSDDLSSAVLTVIERAAIGQVFNVGPLAPVRIRELVSIIGDLSGRSFNDLCTEVPARFGEDDCYWINSDRMRALGWQPRISLTAGLASMVLWAKKFPELAHMHADFVMQP